MYSPNAEPTNNAKTTPTMIPIVKLLPLPSPPLLAFDVVDDGDCVVGEFVVELVVGELDGDTVRDVVGELAVGDAVGELVVGELDDDTVGDVVGELVVGDAVGELVVGELVEDTARYVVGECVGDVVGDVVGDTLW